MRKPWPVSSIGRKLLAAVDLDLQQQQAGFMRVLQPLEARVGDLLTGPARERCFAAYQREPVAFEQCIAKATRRLETGYARNALGLLDRIVRDELDAIAERLRDEANGLAKKPPCPECGVGGGRHGVDCRYAARAA